VVIHVCPNFMLILKDLEEIKKREDKENYPEMKNVLLLHGETRAIQLKWRYKHNMFTYYPP